MGYHYIAEQPSTAIYKTRKGMGVGFVDTLSKSDNIFELQGWSIDASKAPLHGLLIVLNNTLPIFPNEYTCIDRHDVLRTGISSEAKVGFKASFRIPDMNIHAFNVYALDKNGLICTELGLNSILSDIHC